MNENVSSKYIYDHYLQTIRGIFATWLYLSDDRIFFNKSGFVKRYL